MENENGLPAIIAAHRRLWFSQASAEEEVLYGSGGVDIHSTWNMSPVVFIIEPTVYDVVVSNLVVIFPIHKIGMISKGMQLICFWPTQPLSMRVVVVLPSTR